MKLTHKVPKPFTIFFIKPSPQRISLQTPFSSPGTSKSYLHQARLKYPFLQYLISKGAMAFIQRQFLRPGYSDTVQFVP